MTVWVKAVISLTFVVVLIVGYFAPMMESTINAADARVAAQEAAAKVDLFNSAEVYLFPAVTDITCTLTAGTPDDWSAWTEIADSTAVTLSSKFAANAGYLSSLSIYTTSTSGKIFIVEVAYGDAKTIIARTNFHSAERAAPIKSRYIPAGETIYARVMCSGISGSTAKVGFRYFYE